MKKEQQKISRIIEESCRSADGIQQPKKRKAEIADGFLLEKNEVAQILEFSMDSLNMSQNFALSTKRKAERDFPYSHKFKTYLCVSVCL